MDKRPTLDSPILDPSTPAPGRRRAFPVEGLSCASCVGRVERALRALPGASEVSVNLATGRAALRLPGPGEAAVEAVARAGYGVPEAVTTLAIDGLSCASCVGRVERALAAVPAVTAATVNLATGRAEIRHPEGLVARAELEAAVAKAGYEPLAPAEAPVAAGETRARRGRARPCGATSSRRPSCRRRSSSSTWAGTSRRPSRTRSRFAHAVHGALGAWAGWLQAGLATLVLAGPGARFFRQGLPALLRGPPDMNSLVALGSGGRLPLFRRRRPCAGAAAARARRNSTSRPRPSSSR